MQEEKTCIYWNLPHPKNLHNKCCKKQHSHKVLGKNLSLLIISTLGARYTNAWRHDLFV